MCEYTRERERARERGVRALAELGSRPSRAMRLLLLLWWWLWLRLRWLRWLWVSLYLLGSMSSAPCWAVIHTLREPTNHARPHITSVRARTE